MSPTFAVVLHDANDSAFARLKEKYDFYNINPLVAVVRSKDERILAGDVARTAGLSSEGEVPGVVFKLNRASAGFTYSELWEWLEPDD